MKTSLTSAAWAGVITVIAGAIFISGAPRELAFLALPAWPGYFLTFFLGWDLLPRGFPLQRTWRFMS